MSKAEIDGWDAFFGLLNYATDHGLTEEDAKQMRRDGRITDGELAPFIAERQIARASLNELMAKMGPALRDQLAAGEAFRDSIGVGDPPAVWEPLAKAHDAARRHHREICDAIQRLQRAREASW